MADSNKIVIQGISFIRSGCKGLTRENFDKAYGELEDKDGKKVKKYWNKSKKNLDLIWKKLQAELDKKPAKSSESK